TDSSHEQKMAINSFSLFLHQVEKASSNLKLKALQIVFDLLTMYERDFLMAPGNEEQNTLDQVTDFLLNVLGNADGDSIQATAALGLSKLMITGVLQQDRTLGNQQLRQCLSIALPIYAYSTSSNQQRLQRVIIPSIQILDEVYHELEGEQEMITPLQILGTLVDWTDARKLTTRSQAEAALEHQVYEDVHMDLVIEMLTKAFEADDGLRKLYFQILNRLYLPDETDENKLRKVKYLLSSYKIQQDFV
ncbi:13337_t:CDS:2, partial [Acaulospora colombiana]